MKGQAQKPPGRFVRSGKVKDIYDLDRDHLLFHFTDRVSAFDVVLPSSIPRKGEALCKMGEYWFETLGVPNHMVRVEGTNMMVVKKLKMIMVECVVRGYLYGSLYERASKGELSLPVPNVLASKLPAPYFDPTTKSEVHDEPITEAQIDYAKSIVNELRGQMVRAELEFSNDKLQGRILRAEEARVHTMLVVGPRDMQAGAVSVRLHGKGNVGAKPKGEVVADILAAIKERRP